MIASSLAFAHISPHDVQEGTRQCDRLPRFHRYRTRHLNRRCHCRAGCLLAELGYSQGQILGLKQSRAVVPTNWHKWADEERAAPLKLHYSSDLREDGLE